MFKSLFPVDYKDIMKILKAFKQPFKSGQNN